MSANPEYLPQLKCGGRRALDLATYMIAGRGTPDQVAAHTSAHSAVTNRPEEPDGRTAALLGTSGIDRHHPAAMETLSLDEPGPWPLLEVLTNHRASVTLEFETTFQATFPSSSWQQSPNSAVVLPIMPSGETAAPASSSLASIPSDYSMKNYSGFLNLVASQIAAAIVNAGAYEQERRRAEALAEIDRAKTAFFPNVSHEFRTPLTLCPLEDALRNPQNISPKRLEEIAVAHRNALRLLRLVNTLLDFSRIEAGRARALFLETDLSILTRNLASNFDSLCERAGLSFNIVCEPLPRSLMN